MQENLIGRIEFKNGQRFEVVIHNLLEEQTDCIVNAANSFLEHGGGVAASIARAAGPEFQEESRQIIRHRGPVPAGEAVVTTAGKLGFKGVIHAVGPQMGEGDEEQKLFRALSSAFRLAAAQNWKSLSFPAVSSGIFRVPPEICARTYVLSVTDFFNSNPGSCLKLIRLCLFNGPLADLVLGEIKKQIAEKA